MTFSGIKDGQQRRDLIAFLKEVTQHGAHVAQRNGGTGGMMGGMGGMMGGGQVPSRKKLDAEDRVQSITYCKDTYTVATPLATERHGKSGNETCGSRLTPATKARKGMRQRWFRRS